MSDMPREKLALQENVDNLSAQMKEIAAAIFQTGTGLSGIPGLPPALPTFWKRTASRWNADCSACPRPFTPPPVRARPPISPFLPSTTLCPCSDMPAGTTCSAWLRRPRALPCPAPCPRERFMFSAPPPRKAMSGMRAARCPWRRRRLFDSMDAVISTHAEGRTILRQQLRSRADLEMDFHGRAAHAAGAPRTGHQRAGRGRATAIMGINSLRQHMTSDVRIHGLLTDTGTAINTIPEFARLRYGVRARRPETLDRAIERVVNCARCCAQALGCEFSWRHSAHPYYTMRHNMPLLRAFAGNLDLLRAKAISKKCPAAIPPTWGNALRLQGAVNPSLYFHRRRAPCRTHSGLCGSQQLRMRFQGHAPRRASHGHDRLRRALRRGTAAGCPRGLRQRRS